MTIIIGLLGPAGSGKSSAAAYLETKYGAKRYALAAPLKEIAKRTLGFTDEQVYGTQDQKEAVDARYGFSARWFLQRLGTEGCRAVLGEDVWTDACLRRINLDAPRLAVIEDVRFLNENKRIAATGGYVIRLHPPGDAETRTRLTGAGMHASEQEWCSGHVHSEYYPHERSLPLLHAFLDDVMHEIGVES